MPKCGTCDRSFRSENAVEDHCYAKGHWRWFCQPCNRGFKTEQGYDQHCTYAPAHRTCWTCNRLFSTPHGYQRHYETVHAVKRVGCNFCERRFKTPSAYAQHLESGIHGITRHQVVRAVEYLRVVPQITLAPPISYNSTSRIEMVEEYSSDTSTSPTPRAGTPEPIEPGPPLGPREEVAGAAAVAVDPAPAAAPLISTDIAVPGFNRRTRRLGPDPLPLITSGAQALPSYVPSDFTDLGIPYACPICFKTFRNAFSLTSHMNSPVHDPAAFMCPKCDRHFGHVSALIQHLESGSCKLASPAEVFRRFEKLTASFSRLLTA